VPTTPDESRPQLRIERCVCHDVTFREVVDWSKATGCRSVDAAAREFKCTTSCGMCLPYVERALKTGQSVFHEILPLGPGTAR
jgi:NAD(P)H-nitrite reductase large subunit